MSNTYVDVIITLTNLVDSSRFFSPIISWLIVSYVYFAIGVCSGNSLWKHLYLVCTYGLIANLLYAIEEVSEGLDKEQFKHVFRYFKYPESFFFACNEWGLVYINFIKIRSCIKTLKSKFWKIFINILFIYVTSCHLLKAFFEIDEAIVKPKDKFSEKIHTYLYIPIGIMEIYFMFLIICATINEEDEKSKDVLSILLHSSLSRMFIVSLILLGIAIVLCIDHSKGYGLLVKRVLWRLKGGLGIIYLVDLLLIRIDLDSNAIKKYEMKLLKYCMKEKNNEINNDEKGDSETIGLDPEDPYGLNKPPIEYTQHSSTYKNSPTSDFNNNGNIFRNSPTSDYNNGNIFKTTPISEYNRNSSIFMPIQTNTPMINNIMTPYINAINSPTTSNRNSYKKLSIDHTINKNNGE